jgi:cellobiose dehydrogenase (acceptor)
MRAARRRAKERIHWTDTPSTDGVKYLTNGTAIALDALTRADGPGRFRYVVANEDADRERTTSYTEFFFENGEKGGPMATYLVDAAQRDTFTLRMNTSVTRVLRDRGVATGVELESTGPGGLTGRVMVTPGTGRVILSAGVFNTFKILLRSGIGPVENIRLLTTTPSEASKLPPKKDWLDLPAGANLADGPNFSLVVYVPGMQHYPWDQLWNSSTTNPDIARYLANRTGPLAQLQPSLGPVSWDTIMGADGRERVVQWDCNGGQDARLPGDGAYFSPLPDVQDVSLFANSRNRRLHALHVRPESWTHVARRISPRRKHAARQHIEDAVLQRRRGP